VDASWRTFQSGLSSALAAFAQGDARPFKAHWSHTADASILGPFGGYERGWDEIEKRLDWAASMYKGGSQEYETLSEHVGTEFAYTVRLERITTASPNGEIVRKRRVTVVYRHEDDQWRIVHFHADPHVDTAAPRQANDQSIRLVMVCSCRRQ
jgi:ketosteroid isomerase-like protein